MVFGFGSSEVTPVLVSVEIVVICADRRPVHNFEPFVPFEVFASAGYWIRHPANSSVIGPTLIIVLL